MSKRKAEGSLRTDTRQFNEMWENELLFIANSLGKPMCIVCETTFSDNRKNDLSRHYKIHQAEIEGKLKLLPGSDLRKEFVAKFKDDFKKRQNMFITKSCENLAMLEVSYEIAFLLAKKNKPFSDGEEIIKPSLQKFAQSIGDNSIQTKVNEIALSKQTITRRIEELSRDVLEQLKDRFHTCSFFSLALDESADICDVAQLSIFIRGIDDNFNVFEELVGLESLHGRTRGSDIFDKVRSCLENLQLDFSKLLSVCTDGAPSMVGKVSGTVTLLERFVGRPLLKYHCILHQESLCGNVMNLQHVMKPVIKCVNKIRARGLNRREFREYCQLFDIEYGDLAFYCEVRWLSRGQLLERFWKLKSVVGDFLEEKDELPETRSLLCNENWLLDFAFLLDVTIHLNDLNSKLQGKDKLFPNLLENVIAFKKKLKLFVAQLRNKELSNFPYLRQQSECVEGNVNFTEYITKIMLLQESFDGRFSDFSEEENRIVVFLNPFSVTEHNILEMPSQIQMELLDLQSNSVLKMKFNELPTFPSAAETINFWRSLPCEHFPELRKFAQSYACRFGTTYRCEQSFSSMKMIKNKMRSRLTDSNLKNCLVLSTTNLNPNIKDLVKAKQSQKSH